MYVFSWLCHNISNDDEETGDDWIYNINEYKMTKNNVKIVWSNVEYVTGFN